MLLKNVYQWDIDSVKNLATFQEESLDIDRQAERNIYRRGDNVLPGEMVEITPTEYDGETTYSPRKDTTIFFMSREEFLEQLDQDLEQGFLFEDQECYWAFNESYERVNEEFGETPGKDIPQQIIVRATVEHRDGKPVRAEFLEIRGAKISELPNPNAGGIRDVCGDNDVNPSFVVEESDGTHRMDPELYERIYEMYNDGNFHSNGEKAARPVWDTMKRLSRRDMDDRDEFVTSFMRALINHEL